MRVGVVIAACKCWLTLRFEALICLPIVCFQPQTFEDTIKVVQVSPQVLTELHSHSRNFKIDIDRSSLY